MPYNKKFVEIIEFIKSLYPDKTVISLHEPTFTGREKEYLLDCIESTYVSYVGKYVDRFGEIMKEYIGCKYAIAVVNGTSALHIALKIAGVNPGDEVLTVPLTFVATINAVSYCNAHPVFIDADLKTLGMSTESLEEFLNTNTFIDDLGNCINKLTRAHISACVPVHVFGHPCSIDNIVNICNKFNISVIEDAAESIGSRYLNKHTGTFGKLAIQSFNGNKIITTGGGGMILTDSEEFAVRARHLTTTAKVFHPWEYIHDEVGYNYRMSNLNAAVGCAQMENLDTLLKNKRRLAESYSGFFKQSGIEFFDEPVNCRSNYWLNVIFMKDRNERDEFLEFTNSHGIKTRPAWRLSNKLDMYGSCQKTDLSNAIRLENTLVNLPSSPTIDNR